MHTQRIYEHHESESQLSRISSELLYMESATQLSLSLCSSSMLSLLFIIMLQYTMRVSIFRFPSLILNCLIYALKLPTNINAFLVLQTRAGRSRSDYNLLVRLSLTITFKFGASNLQNFLNNVSCAQNVLWLPHARLTLAMLLHHTPSLENFHGLLSMSSRTVFPCF
jgi:hypothetical protein